MTTRIIDTRIRFEIEDEAWLTERELSPEGFFSFLDEAFASTSEHMSGGLRTWSVLVDHATVTPLHSEEATHRNPVWPTIWPRT